MYVVMYIFPSIVHRTSLYRVIWISHVWYSHVATVCYNVHVKMFCFRDEGSFDVTSGSGDGMGNFYGGRGIDAGGKAANDDIEKCTDDVGRSDGGGGRDIDWSGGH